MFAASKSGSADAKDPQFNYVTMLLHGNGTNGAQNKTFVDSSTNNFTITRNGNTTQGTFSPYGSNWSNFFDGTGDYLSLSDNAALQWSTGDFCVEAWIYPSSVSGSKAIVCKGTNNTGTFDLGLYGAKIELYTTALVFSSSASLSANTWTHVAVTRSGTTLRCFINGALDTTVTSSYNFNNAGTFYVGVYGSGSVNYFNGYMSNVRCVKGSAVYTSAFTPSTTPLTAITNTSLLTCADNRFIDDSTNNFTITRNGDVSVQRFSPFSPTSAYSTSVIGGSGYFDGSGDFLSFANNTAFTFGTGDFTVETFIYRLGTGSGSTVYDSVIGGNTDVAAYWNLYVNNSNNTIAWYGNDSVLRSTSNTITNNTWNHVAVSRSGSTLKIFINGVEGYSATVTTSYSLGSFGGYVGYDGPNGTATGNRYFYGYISNARVVKGTAVYTSAFTPPTAPLTAITNTSLLLNNTNAGILDNAMMNDLETVGNAQISTSVKKYGTGSMYFDGTGDYLVPSAPSSNVTLGLGSGDFTVEFWVYFIGGLGSDIVLFDGRPLSTNGAYPTIYVNSSSQVSYVVSSADRITSASAFSTSTWYHIAVARNGTSTKMFVNGTQVGSTYTDSTNYLSASRRPVIAINGFNETAAPLNGYIDDLRITKGVARYTTTFTPPTTAFPDKG